MAGGKRDNAGRPSDYSDATASEICERLASGETLTEICADAHMPHRVTVNRWLLNDAHTEFASQYARARESCGDVEADESKRLYGQITSGSITPDQGRVLLNIVTWRAKILNPKRYGDKIAQELSGPGGAPIESRHEIEFINAPTPKPEH